jgi:hypothetical protein
LPTTSKQGKCNSLGSQEFYKIHTASGTVTLG